jgi:hypothetical protein
MGGRVRKAGLIGAALVLATYGCTSGIPVVRPAPALSIDRQAFTERLAHPRVYDWSSSRLTTPAAAMLRQQTAGQRPKRSVQALASIWSGAPADFNATATGRISSAPAYDYWGQAAYWLTETGWVLKRNVTTSAVTAFRLKEANNSTLVLDTFSNTGITISNDGLRIYVCSGQGRFFAIDAQTGLNLPGSPYAMGGAALEVGVNPPPHIDVFASRDDGQFETVYAINNAGKLHRFFVDARRTITTPSVYMAQAYQMPASTGAYVDRFRVSPLVYNGKVYVGYWRDNIASALLDTGGVIQYDTGCTSPTADTTIGSTIRNVGLSSPIYSPLALEFDDALNPILAFVPTGMTVTMIDLTSGNYSQSVPLVVDAKTPLRGSLEGYAYSASGVSTVDIPVEGNAALTMFQDGVKDTANVYGAARRTSGDTTQAYGYAKFAFENDDLVEAGQLKVVTDAYLRLKCTGGSSLFGIGATEPPRAYKLGNKVLLNQDWTNTNVSPLIRPTFESGMAFTNANLASQSAKRLEPFTTTTYAVNTTYSMPARGQVGGPDTYTFGLAHTELYRDALLGFLGIVLWPAAPRFEASSAQLRLTLSGAGFVNPSPINAVTINAATQEIYIGNTNALFKVSYAGTTFEARASNFDTDRSTFYALSRIGQDLDTPGQGGPTYKVVGSVFRFVENCTAPLFDGVNVYFQDNHPKLIKTSINAFIPGAPGVAPTLGSYLVLNGTDSEVGPSHMAYDYESDRLFVSGASLDPLLGQGRAYIFDRF